MRSKADLNAPSLFDSEEFAPAAKLLRGFAIPEEAALLKGLEEIMVQAPFRHMVTPGGFRMSVAMTNCGPLGWVSDRTGYRYGRLDPDTGLALPLLPPV